MKISFLIVFALVWPLIAVAQDLEKSSAIFSLEAGVVCPPPTVGTVPAPGTVAGTTYIIDEVPPFVTKARNVPAVIGIGFGVKAMSVNDFGIEDVTIVVTHPPMGADRIRIQKFASRISGIDPSITFYQFDYDYELIPGQWKMMAVHQDEVLYSVAFEVVPPSQIPELAKICGYKNLLS